MKMLVSLLFSIAAFSCLAADPAGASAVPPENLDGNKLILKDLNVTIAAPGADWKWSKANSGGVSGYVCRKGKEAFAVMPHPLTQFDAAAMKNIATGITSAATKAGYSVSEPKIAPADKPWADRTFRIAYSMTSPNGQSKMNAFMYVLKIDEKNALVLQSGGADETESPEFTKFLTGIEQKK